jgi:hypothetical protein
MDDRRDEFLVEMYRQMFNDINRHILVVWQSVGVVIGAFAIFALVEKNILSADLASTIIVLLCAWLFAHLVDAGYWYNRNLVIIANIERQFLVEGDLKNIQNYFGKHRPNNKMITHLRIQVALGIGLAALVLLYHFYTRVMPGLSTPWSDFEFVRMLPYLTAIGAVVYGRHLVKTRNTAYREFIKYSPGIDVATTGIEYGVGHGFGKSSKD